MSLRLLYVSERPPYPFFLGGAARCAHELLLRFSRDQGVECLAVGDAGFSHPPWSWPAEESFAQLGIREIREDGGRRCIDCGYPVEVLPDLDKSLDECIEAFAPDVIWTQMEGAEKVLGTAARHRVPAFYFVHDAELPDKASRRLAALGADFVASSRFLADKAHRVVHRQVEVVYPCPRTDFGVAGDPKGFITMINPHRVKGVETFYEIARAFPAERFLLLESWRLDEAALAEVQHRLEELPNVIFHRRVADMAEIYAQTRLLVVPSVWEEGFGMVVVEAQSCGIPVIASRRGGLTEAVGQGGILVDDYRNADAWGMTLQSLLQDGDRYRDLAAGARQQIAEGRFSCDHSAETLMRVAMGLKHGERPIASLADRIRSRLESIARWRDNRP